MIPNNIEINYELISVSEIEYIHKYFGKDTILKIYPNISQSNLKKILEGTNYREEIISSLFHKIINEELSEDKLEFLILSGLDVEKSLDIYLKIHNVKGANIFYDRLLSKGFDGRELLSSIPREIIFGY